MPLMVLMLGAEGGATAARPYHRFNRLRANGFMSDEYPLKLYQADQTRADFAGDVPDDAKLGPLQNMLSAAVLDAAEFPAITVKSVALAIPQGAAGATGTVQVVGRLGRRVSNSNSSAICSPRSKR